MIIEMMIPCHFIAIEYCDINLYFIHGFHPCMAPLLSVIYFVVHQNPQKDVAGYFPDMQMQVSNIN